MDYKYIEQLLERYWQAETSIEEEEILRTFFNQKDVPAELAQYRALFAYEQQTKKEERLGDDFDSKILSMIGNEEPVKARLIPISQRLMPLFKAAAVVAIIVTLGNAAQLSFSPREADDDINYANYKDTYQNPSEAYDKVENALQLVSEGISQVQGADTTIVNSINAKDSLMKE